MTFPDRTSVWAESGLVQEGQIVTCISDLSNEMHLMCVAYFGRKREEKKNPEIKYFLSSLVSVLLL